MGASGSEASGASPYPERGMSGLGQEPTTPGGAPFGEWLDRQVRGGRLSRDRSRPAISSACCAALDEIRRTREAVWLLSEGGKLREPGGVSRRPASR